MFDLDLDRLMEEPPEADLIPPMTRIAVALELLLFWIRPTALALITIAVSEVLRGLRLL